MFCQMCGSEIQGTAVFCSQCGSPVAESPDILDEAINEAREVFDAELEASGIDVSNGENPEAGTDTDTSKKSARERIQDIKKAVVKGKDSAVEITRNVRDTTSRAAKRAKEVSDSVKITVDTTVDKTRKIGEDASVVARKVGDGARHVAKRTKKTVDDLGQVGVIITQRATDVVRASLKAVENVDDYLRRSKSKYEVGNFLTGVGLPPYLEIHFAKRSGKLTIEEMELIKVIRESGIELDEVEKMVKSFKTPKKKVGRKKEG